MTDFMKSKITYRQLEGLSKKDPFKKGMMDIMKNTSHFLAEAAMGIVAESVGEPAALIDFKNYDFYLAFKTDGVGTKSLVADEMAKHNKNISSLYGGLGIDLIASNVNDLICVGATPIALSDEIAFGDAQTFEDKEKMAGLITGLKKGCLEAQITIPCGESPTLRGILSKSCMNITGSAIGIVRPKKNLILGDKLHNGDCIIGLASSGIHANGLMLAREITEKLPDGYWTKFDKSTIGQELLAPTQIYSKPILEMLKQNIEIHYMSNITGSSWRKIMRAKKEFSYEITNVCPKPKIMEFLQTQGNLSDREVYETWNMGLGFVIFAPPKEFSKIQAVCTKRNIKSWKLGIVKTGPKQVIVKPLGFVYKYNDE